MNIKMTRAVCVGSQMNTRFGSCRNVTLNRAYRYRSTLTLNRGDEKKVRIAAAKKLFNSMWDIYTTIFDRIHIYLEWQTVLTMIAGTAFFAVLAKKLGVTDLVNNLLPFITNVFAVAPKWCICIMIVMTVCYGDLDTAKKFASAVISAIPGTSLSEAERSRLQTQLQTRVEELFLDIKDLHGSKDIDFKKTAMRDAADIGLSRLQSRTISNRVQNESGSGISTKFEFTSDSTVADRARSALQDAKSFLKTRIDNKLKPAS